MKFFGTVNGYLRKALLVLRQRGIKGALSFLKSKLRVRFQTGKSQLSVEDWLSFYERRSEIHQWSNPETQATPKVSILILTYNNLAINQLCLHSIYCNTTYPDFEIIVVDNASSDDTPAWLKSFSKSHPNLKLILNSENRGFAAGNNQAAQLAAGEFLVFLNNDTVVTTGWIERLLVHLQDHPDIGLVGPVTNATGNEALIQVSYTTPSEMESFASERARFMPGQSFEIRMLAFYCVMARRSEYESLGGLDERYSVGMFEDEDMALQYQQRGFKIVCAEDVFIHHFQRASFGKLDIDKYQGIFEENRKKFEEKWGHTWEPYQLRQPASLPLPVMNANPVQKTLGILKYQCNICGKECETPIIELTREKPSCECGSTVRSRSIVHLLSKELFGQSYILPDLPVRPDLQGWGMSDAGYANLLSKKIGYINTFYDRKPYFDITAPLDPEIEGTLDFLISTEVFEHVAPPVSRAFENAKKLLKPGGLFLLTVPYTLEPATLEHFPELHQYRLVKRKGHGLILKNITTDGREQLFDNLIFHGGVGTTLEMRVFSQNGLIGELKQADFRNIRICSEPYWEFGIYWHQPWSLPIVARS